VIARSLWILPLLAVTGPAQAGSAGERELRIVAAPAAEVWAAWATSAGAQTFCAPPPAARRSLR
jgi:hypothetical protein